MKIIKENINNYKDPLTTVINTAEADAVRDDKKVQKETEDILDPMKLKKKKPFTGADKQKGPDQKDLPSKLENKLTEDVDYSLARPNENRIWFFIENYDLDESTVLSELLGSLPDSALADYVETLESYFEDDEEELEEDYGDYGVNDDAPNDYEADDDMPNDYEVDDDAPNDYEVDDDANSDYTYYESLKNGIIKEDYDDESEIYYAWEIRNAYNDECILCSVDTGLEFDDENYALMDAEGHLDELRYDDEEADNYYAVIQIFNPETGDYEDYYTI